MRAKAGCAKGQGYNAQFQEVSSRASDQDRTCRCTQKEGGKTTPKAAFANAMGAAMIRVRRRRQDEYPARAEYSVALKLPVPSASGKNPRNEKET
jgi:hypothetical protein